MLKDLYAEITGFIKGKTIDAIIPSILFVSLNAIFGLVLGIFGSLVFSISLILFRIYQKKDIKYGLVGLVMLIIASGLSLLTNNPKTYFLPDLITNLLIVIGILFSFIFRKPFAAYASHLTRAWPLEWYWRLDIKPAYLEVSIIWFIFFTFKSIIQIVNLFGSNINSSFINLLLGFPFTLIVMSISYIYGIFRLKQLKGPSVYEFIQNKEKPFKGQTKGF